MRNPSEAHFLCSVVLESGNTKGGPSITTIGKLVRRATYEPSLAIRRQLEGDIKPELYEIISTTVSATHSNHFSRCYATLSVQ